MPIPMIATGNTRVHQNSSEFFFKIELSKLVCMLIWNFYFSSVFFCYLTGSLLKAPIASSDKSHNFSAQSPLSAAEISDFSAQSERNLLEGLFKQEILASPEEHLLGSADAGINPAGTIRHH